MIARTLLKTKAAEPEFDRLTRSEISRKPKLTARPQYEAHAHVIYFDFFLAFFFFVAMTVFLRVCDEPTAGLVQVAGFVLGPWAFAPLPKVTMAQGSPGRNQKTEIILIFP